MPTEASGNDENLAGAARTKLPSPEEYAKFVNGIELLDVRLVNSEVNSGAIRPDPSSLQLHVKYGSNVVRLDGAEPFEFEAYPSLEVTARRAGTDERTGTVRVRLGLRYRSVLEPTDPYLEVFSKVNLQVNAWPYLREYVHQTITRFGWTPLVLPTLKTNNARKPRAKKD